LCKEGLIHVVARVQAKGYSPALIELDFPHDTPERERIIELLPAGTLDVLLQDLRDQPTAPLSIELRTAASALAQPDVSSLVSDVEVFSAVLEDGRFHFEALPARVSLSARLAGSKGTVAVWPDPLVLEPGETRRLDWVLGGGTRISGKVVDQFGAPGAHAPILLCRHASAGDAQPGRCYFDLSDGDENVQRAETDGDGAFVLSGVQPGRYWLGIEHEFKGWAPPGPNSLAPIGECIEVLAAVPSQSVVIRSARGLFLKGRLLDPDGKPAREQLVSAKCASVFGRMTASTKDDGSFVIGPLVDEVHSCCCPVADSHAPSETVSERPGGPEVVLHLTTGASLSGSAFDVAGGAHPGCVLLLSRVEDPMTS
jgi:hypothetical protein